MLLVLPERIYIPQHGLAFYFRVCFCDSWRTNLENSNKSYKSGMSRRMFQLAVTLLTLLPRTVSGGLMDQFTGFSDLHPTDLGPLDPALDPSFPPDLSFHVDPALPSDFPPDFPPVDSNVPQTIPSDPPTGNIDNTNNPGTDVNMLPDVFPPDILLPNGLNTGSGDIGAPLGPSNNPEQSLPQAPPVDVVSNDRPRPVNAVPNDRPRPVGVVASNQTPLVGPDVFGDSGVWPETAQMVVPGQDVANEGIPLGGGAKRKGGATCNGWRKRHNMCTTGTKPTRQERKRARQQRRLERKQRKKGKRGGGGGGGGGGGKVGGARPLKGPKVKTIKKIQPVDLNAETGAVVGGAGGGGKRKKGGKRKGGKGKAGQQTPETVEYANEQFIPGLGLIQFRK